MKVGNAGWRVQPSRAWHHKIGHAQSHARTQVVALDTVGAGACDEQASVRMEDEPIWCDQTAKTWSDNESQVAQVRVAEFPHGPNRAVCHVDVAIRTKNHIIVNAYAGNIGWRRCVAKLAR